jgi:hypothetical protein
MRSEVPLAVAMKITVFGNVMPCSLVDHYKCFERTCSPIFKVHGGSGFL